MLSINAIANSYIVCDWHFEIEKLMSHGACLSLYNDSHGTPK